MDQNDNFKDNENIENIENSNNQPKNFYSLNLTEGRIFIIFVAMVMFIVLSIFAVFGIIKLAIKNDTENGNLVEENNNESEFIFYDDLVSDNKNILTINNDESSDKIKSNVTENKSAVTDTENVNNQKEIKNSEEIVKVDDSDVLYSSENEAFIEENKDYGTTTIKTVTTSTTIAKKENSVYYVIQIGSYKNKDAVLEIENFYKKAGYPTYVKEVKKDGETFYRLRIGPFNEKMKADQYLSTLKGSKYGKNSYISIVYL